MKSNAAHGLAPGSPAGRRWFPFCAAVLLLAGGKANALDPSATAWVHARLTDLAAHAQPEGGQARAQAAAAAPGKDAPSADPPRTADPPAVAQAPPARQLQPVRDAGEPVRAGSDRIAAQPVHGRREPPVQDAAVLPVAVPAAPKEDSPVPAIDAPKARAVSLRTVIAAAISRHPDIGRAKAAVAQGASQLEVAKAAWYPTIEYAVRPGHTSNTVNAGSKDEARASIGIDQTLYDFGRTTSRIAGATSSLERQRHLLADAIANVAYDTALIHVQIAAEQERMVAAEQQLNALRATRSKIVERVRAGLSPASDRNLIEVTISRAEADLLGARADRETAVAKLAEITGLRPGRVEDLAQTGRWIDRIQAAGNGDADQAPAVRAALSALESADAGLKVAQAERFPRISLVTSHTLSSGRGSAPVDTWVGISLSGNFSLGGMASNQVAAAAAERQAASEVVESQRLAARTTLASAAIEKRGALEKATNHRRVIELSRASRELFWQEYTLGKRALTEVINPDREIYQAETDLIRAVAAGLTADIKGHVAGGRFVDSLLSLEELNEK